MLIFAEFVKETSSTTGTGTYSLGGAVTGFRTFVAGIGTTNTCFYCATDNVDWEIGYGTVTDSSPDTLSRTTIVASSNSGSAVSWSAGTRIIFCVEPARMVGSLVLLQEQTAASSATMDFTTYINDDFDSYELHFGDVRPATDDVTMRIRVSTDGGSSWDTGASIYSSNYSQSRIAASAWAATVNGNQDRIDITNRVGNNTNEYLSGMVKVYNARSTTSYKHFETRTTSYNSNAELQMSYGCGAYKSATAINGIRLYMSSGAVTSGWFRLYAVRRT